MQSKKKLYGSIFITIFFSLVLVLVFVLGFTLGTSSNQKNNDINDINASIQGEGKSWADSTNTTYYISSSDDLDLFRKEVNDYAKTFAGCTVYLTKDLRITGTWTPIGNVNTESNTFKGTFDGQGFSIISAGATSGLYGTSGNLGFFGYTYGCIIKNLGLNGINFQSSGYIGGLVAYQSGGSLTITNCDINIDEELKGNHVGGMIGYINSSNTLTITDCNVYASKNITALNSNAGGMIGYVSSTNININNCKVIMPNSTITSTSSSGGLIGYRSGSGSISFSDIDVQVLSIVSTGDRSAGLIGYDSIGSCAPTYTNINILVNNINSKCYTGGLIGYHGNNSDANNKSAFSNITINFVKIISERSDTSATYAGGLIGYLQKYCTFTNCKVLKFKNADGGIIGTHNVSSYKSVSESTVSSSVYLSETSAGGMIGYLNSYGCIFTNCEVNINYGTYGIKAYGSASARAYANSGATTASASASASSKYAGGLIGYSSANNTNNNISGCFIKMSGVQYGIYSEAYASSNSSTYSSYKAASDSTGYAYAGGVVGRSSYTNISNTKIQISSSSYSIYGNGNTSATSNGYTSSSSSYSATNGYTNNSSYATATISGASYTGGIVGQLASTSVLTNNIVNCGNTSSTGIYSLVGGSESYAGGIVGKSNSSCTITGQKIENSYIYSRVYNYTSSKTSYAGGIAGYLYNGNNMNTCSVSGTIQTNAYSQYNSSTTYYGTEYCGGIVGNNQGIINDCLNMAVVTANKTNNTQYAGGVVGYGRNSSSYYATRCGNLGTVTGYRAFAIGYYQYAKDSFAECTLNSGSTSSSYVGYSSSTNGTNIYQLAGSSTSASNATYLKNLAKFTELGYLDNGWTMTDGSHPTINVTCENVSATSGSTKVAYSYSLYKFNSKTSKVNVSDFGISFKLAPDDKSNIISQGMATLQMNSNSIYTLSKAYDDVDLGYCKIKYAYVGNYLDLIVYDGNPSVATNQKYNITYNYNFFKFDNEHLYINSYNFDLDYITNKYTVTYEVEFDGGYFPKFREIKNGWSYIADKSGDSLNNGSCIYRYTFRDGVLNLTIFGRYDFANPPAFEMSTFQSSFNEAKSVSVTSSTGDINVRTVYDGMNAKTFIKPTGAQHVQSIIIDNLYEIEIAYYRATIYEVGKAYNIEYSAKAYDNTLSLSFEGIFDDINIVVNLVTGAENTNLKEPVSAAGGVKIDGVVVKAQVGGEARIVGNEIQDSSVSESEEVTLVAVAYSGYKFMGWISNDGSEVPNANSATLKISKTNALNKIFIAQFAKIADDSNVNGTTDDGIII